MRRTLIAIFVVLVVLAGFIAWPVYDLYRLAHAVENRDLPKIVAHVNIAQLQRSLTVQVLRKYGELTGRKMSPLMANLAVGAGSAVIDPIVAKLITNEAIADLLLRGWPKALGNKDVPKFDGLNARAFGNLGVLFQNSDYGFRRYSVWVPPDKPRAQQFNLRFRLQSWTWKLIAVRLPEELQTRLAREVIKRTEALADNPLRGGTN
jgi:hypothetical protein